MLGARYFGMSMLLAACLAGAIGCGSVNDDNTREPLATLTGELTQSTTSPAPVTASSNVRIAVVWMAPSNVAWHVANDAQATPVFPSRFEVALDPPPADAMHTEDPSSSIAIGSIVAYDDRNGNGQLDLVDTNASSFVDKILGANDYLYLVYFEGAVPNNAASNVLWFGNVASDGSQPTLGYNIAKLRNCWLAPPDQYCSMDLESWLPTTATFDLTLSADPRWSTMMCSNQSWSPGSASDGPTQPAPGPNGWPAKDDPNLACFGDGRAYSTMTCPPGAMGLCGGDISSCVVTIWTMPSDPPPPEWPCTLK